MRKKINYILIILTRINIINNIYLNSYKLSNLIKYNVI